MVSTDGFVVVVVVIVIEDAILSLMVRMVSSIYNRDATVRIGMRLV